MPFIQAANIKFHYEVLGSKTTQPPLILIAGYACDINFWRPVAEAMAKTTQVLIFDNQGIGQTTDAGGTLTIEAMTANIKALIDALVAKEELSAGPYDIGAFAMGGLIGQQFAADYPESTHKLILLNSVLKFNDKAKACCEALCAAREAGDFNAYAGLIYDHIMGEAFQSTNARDEFVEFFAEIVVDVQSAEDQRRQIELLKICDSNAVAPEIKAPTLIIHTKQDDLFALPVEIATLKKAIATSGTAVTLYPIDCGHAPAPENLDALIAGIKSFLNINNRK